MTHLPSRSLLEAVREIRPGTEIILRMRDGRRLRGSLEGGEDGTVAADCTVRLSGRPEPISLFEVATVHIDVSTKGPE